jgi:hypothetical protein
MWNKWSARMLDQAPEPNECQGFFFHVRDSGDNLDGEGTELADDGVAKAEAAVYPVNY